MAQCEKENVVRLLKGRRWRERERQRGRERDRERERQRQREITQSIQNAKIYILPKTTSFLRHLDSKLMQRMQKRNTRVLDRRQNCNREIKSNK